MVACDRTSDEEQIAELEQQVADLEADLEQTQAALDESEGANADLQEQLADVRSELADTQEALAATEEELGTTQAELLDAQAQLAKVGEVRLEDGTYVGQVLGAKASPYRVIIFDAAGLYRVAQVSKEVTITAGGDDLTLSQFGKLLSSADPDDAKLANGNYQVIVRNGLVTSIRKSQA
jgi:regulator of replication initiation timing